MKLKLLLSKAGVDLDFDDSKETLEDWVIEGLCEREYFSWYDGKFFVFDEAERKARKEARRHLRKRELLEEDLKSVKPITEWALVIAGVILCFYPYDKSSHSAVLAALIFHTPILIEVTIPGFFSGIGELMKIGYSRLAGTHKQHS